MNAVGPPSDMVYFMALWGIADEFGGMTTMSLYRACMFLEEAGISAPILTFEPRSGYDRQIRTLRSHGKITTDITVLNPFMHYRQSTQPAPPEAERFEPAAANPPDAAGEELDAEGLVFCRTTFQPDGETVAAREYLRPDGTAFLHDEFPVGEDGKKAGRILTLVSADGLVSGRWRTAGDFYRQWLVELAGGRPAAIIVDSAFAGKVMAPLRERNIIKMVVLHNAHVAGGGDPVRGKIASGQQSILSSVNDWDGIVFLTDEQRQDYEARFGRTSNLFTISNPKQRAGKLPDFAQRSTRRGVLLGRLAPQKNLTHAIRVMAKARESLPDLTLDIYGKGPDEAELRELIAELDLAETVHLLGHIPHAADQFDIARFSLLTSRNEGQPLALMESQGRGCTPVSYAIRYGPRDIIEDGVNGYLVESGDVDAAASRIVSLCTDDALAERMGRAAWERAERFSNHAIVARWLEAVGVAWHQRELRSQVSDLVLRVEEIAWLRQGSVEFTVRLSWKQLGGPPLEDALAVCFMVVPRGAGAALGVPVRTLQSSPGEVSAVARLDPASWRTGIDGGEEYLDVFCQVAGADVAAMFRVGYPDGCTTLPFITTQHGLGLRKDERR